MLQSGNILLARHFGPSKSKYNKINTEPSRIRSIYVLQKRNRQISIISFCLLDCYVLQISISTDLRVVFVNTFQYMKRNRKWFKILAFTTNFFFEWHISNNDPNIDDVYVMYTKNMERRFSRCKFCFPFVDFRYEIYVSQLCTPVI